jgi:N-acetylneuraminic acid mutarotase
MNQQARGEQDFGRSRRRNLLWIQCSTVKIGRMIIAGSLALLTGQCGPEDEVVIPVITELSVSPGSVDLGGSVWVECVLAQELLEEPTYTWAATGGWFRGEGAGVNWDAPLVEGEYTLTCRVEDNRGNRDSAAVVVMVEAQDHPEGHWIVRAPMPTIRQELSAVTLGGEIYVVGGMDGNGSPLARVEAYDPATNTWEAKAPLPAPRHHVAIATLEGKLYAIGGVGTTVPTWVAAREVYEYDPFEDTWREVTTMPSSRIEQVAIGLQGRIHVIGGRQGSDRVVTHEAYDPVSDSWTTLAPARVPLSHSAVTVMDARIYVVGGRDLKFVEGTYEVVNSRHLQEYNPASNTWRTLKLMPTARGGLAAAVLEGMLYVFGGENLGTQDTPATVYDATEVYDPATSSWVSLAPMLTPRHGMGAAAVEGVIYVIGGGTQAAIAPSTTNEGFVP